jgi:hypothetical protein
MNGAIAEPSEKTTRRLNKSKIKIIGASHIFFLTRMNSQNSFNISSLFAM